MVLQMRLRNWQCLFADFVTRRRHEKFSWGKNDCCLFAADSTLTITGNDFAAAYRGSYSDETSAMALIAEFGSLEQLCSTLTGIAPISAVYADVGDIVIAKYAGRELLAVSNGIHVLAVGSEGMIILPLAVCTKTWKI